MMKKIYMLAASVFVFALPSLTFASPRPIDFALRASSSGFFSSLQYKYAIPYFGKFSLESNGKPLELFSVKSDADEEKDVSAHDSFEGPYSPAYQRNKNAFSVSAGYSAGNARFEVEGIFQKFLIKDKKYQFRDNAYSFAAAEKDESVTGVAVRPPEKYYVSLQNKDLAITTLMANACYDLIPEDGRVSPSACVGAGMGFVKFLGVLEQRKMYQAKVGLQYFVSRKTVIFASAYINKVGERKFERIHTTHHIHIPAASKENEEAEADAPPRPPAEASEPQAEATGKKIDYLLYPSAKMPMAYYGLELGIRLVL